MRVDMLLNPGTPPLSPVLVSIRTESPEEPLDGMKLSRTSSSSSTPTFVGSVGTIPKDQHPVNSIVLPSEIFLASNQDDNTDEDGDVIRTAAKRPRRELPGVRLLLQCVENQREEAAEERPEISAGTAFWSKVAALNAEPSTDVDNAVHEAAHIQPTVSVVVEDVAAIRSAMGSSSSNPEEVDHEGQSTSPEEEDQSVGAKRKKVSTCKELGCKSQALSKQLCMKHGGGPRCSYPDCNNGAKLRNLCFQHGGSTICLAPGCLSKAKRFGYCWSHGGGRICGDEDCNKVAAQGGMCWAHGGGNRCKLEGCTKRSYKQYDYFCKRHAGETVADY